jgi:MFS family permease
MSAVTPAHDVTLRTAVMAAVAMLGLQTLSSMSQAVPSVLAPVAALDMGLQPSGVGVMVGLSYLGGMISGLSTGVLTARLGAWRVCQLAGLICALALVGMALSGGLSVMFPAVPATLLSVLLIVSSMLTGLGIGMINPVSSQILFHASPAELRSFIFSIKQTGVPAGAALAGSLLPALLLMLSWEAATLALALLIAAYSILMIFMGLEKSVPLPPAQDATAGGGNGRARIGLSDFTGPVKMVWSQPALREMGIVSLCFSSNQLAFTVFLVSYLKIEIGLSLVTAGLVYAIAQGVGVLGRIMWGVSADLWVTPRTQLGLLGIAGGASAIGVSLLSPQWTVPVIAVVCALSGATAVSWNGVFLSELAGISPPGSIATVTGGAQFFMFMGALGGPALFSMIVAASGSYAPGFAVFAVAPMLAGAWLLLRRRAA